MFATWRIRPVFPNINQAERIARREAKAVCGKGTMTGDGPTQSGIGVSGNQTGLRERRLCASDFDAIGNPASALAGEPTGGKLIAKRAVGIRAEKLQVRLRGIRQYEAAGGQALQLRRKFGESEHRKSWSGNVEFRRR